MKKPENAIRLYVFVFSLLEPFLFILFREAFLSNADTTSSLSIFILHATEYPLFLSQIHVVAVWGCKLKF